MVITRTPFRIGLLGGGSDIHTFVESGNIGAVLNMAIDKYVYVSVNKSFSGKYRLAYSRVEEADTIDGLQNERAKLCLQRLSCGPVEVTSTADIPTGTGLGGSSSYTVSLLNALKTYNANMKLESVVVDVPRIASDMEIALADGTIGRQDHYAAFNGGLSLYIFSPRCTVHQSQLSPVIGSWIYQCSSLYYIHREREENCAKVYPTHDELSALSKSTITAYKKIKSAYDESNAKYNVLRHIGDAMREQWEYKKHSYCDFAINDAINDVCHLGAYGAKACGQSGGGFIFILHSETVEKEIRMHVENVYGWRRVPFGSDLSGSTVIYGGP